MSCSHGYVPKLGALHAFTYRGVNNLFLDGFAVFHRESCPIVAGFAELPTSMLTRTALVEIVSSSGRRLAGKHRGPNVTRELEREFFGEAVVQNDLKHDDAP